MLDISLARLSGAVAGWQRDHGRSEGQLLQHAATPSPLRNLPVKAYSASYLLQHDMMIVSPKPTEAPAALQQWSWTLQATRSVPPRDAFDTSEAAGPVVLRDVTAKVRAARMCAVCGLSEHCVHGRVSPPAHDAHVALSVQKCDSAEFGADKCSWLNDSSSLCCVARADCKDRAEMA